MLRWGGGAAPPKGPNLEGSDPGAPVHPGGLVAARRSQSPPGRRPLLAAAGPFGSEAGGPGGERRKE